LVKEREFLAGGDRLWAGFFVSFTWIVMIREVGSNYNPLGWQLVANISRTHEGTGAYGKLE